MIGRLSGTLLEKKAPQLLVDVGGIGYELEVPMSTFFELPLVGEPVTLVTHFHVREDAQILYGFLTESERRLFRLLLKVNGVGAKMTLAILSGMNPEEFRQCILSGDQVTLVRVPGIGKKTAERLIVEMRDRVKKMGGETSASAVSTASVADPVAEATEALIALGYRPAEASRMVSKVAAPEHGSETMIRLALKGAM